ncbi:MAG: PEP-CTERM sorting domain-containing protein [Gammaproteobacteria bacterium]|nr:PEP-CTERM sorting domain-containing protein [Gammaproteobacteria bacterium]
MNKLTKIAAASVVTLGLGLGMAGQAQAVVFYQDTVANWLAAGSVLDADGDTTWDLASYSDGTGAYDDIGWAVVTLSEDDVGGEDIYKVSLNFVESPISGFGPSQSSFWNYVANVVLPSDENFLHVSMDSDVPADTSIVNVTKEITLSDGTVVTLQSMAGAPDGPSPLSGQSISMNETFVAGEDGILNSTTNTFVLAAIPEPGSILLFGIGLMGMVFGQRKMARRV